MKLKVTEQSHEVDIGQRATINLNVGQRSVKNSREYVKVNKEDQIRAGKCVGKKSLNVMERSCLF